MPKQKCIIEDVQKYFNNTGSKLISCINSKQIKFICKCGKHTTKRLISIVKYPYCQTCSHKLGAKRLTTQQFIEKSIEIHGPFYDYTKVNYINSNQEVEIGCPKHGTFFQKPICHTIGHGCPECGKEKTRKSQIKSDDWETTEKIINEAIKICNGEFPTQTLIKKYDLWDANRVIKKLGGWPEARKKFGHGPAQKPKGYWKDPDNVVKELNEHFPKMMAAKIIPTSQMLRNVGIESQITNHHGSIGQIAKKLGCEISTRWITRDGDIVLSYGELLLDEYMYSREITHIANIIVKNGPYFCDQFLPLINGYIELWGYPQRKHRVLDAYNKKRGKKEEFYKKQKLNLISIEGRSLQRGRIEEVEEYLDTLFSELGFDITKKHEFNFNVLHKCSGYHINEQLVIDKIQKEWDMQGAFPTQRTNTTPGLNDLVQQFGGWPYFREKMGAEQWKPEHKWSLDEIFKQLKNICITLGRFPKSSEVPNDLLTAIYNCHYIERHDLNWYRDNLGYSIERKSIGYWANDDNIESEILILIKEYGKFPTNTFLRSIDRSDLASAIQKRKNGFDYWRNKLNHPVVRPIKWNESTIEANINEIIKQYNQFPTNNFLRSINRNDLAGAVSKNGGYPYFRNKMDKT